MRRSTTTIVGAVVLAVGVGAGTAAAIGVSGGGSSAKTQANHIASALATPAGRAHYGISDGRLVAADVCVRRTSHSVTISAEVA